MLVNHSLDTSAVGRGAATTTWVGATAWQIAHAVRRGDATAAEVVADHLDHARVAEAILSVLRHLRAGAAIAEAEQVDEQPDLGSLPLAGVPVLIRESVPLAGLPVGGAAGAAGAVACGDHEVVRRLRGAGAVVLGTGRMPEGRAADPDHERASRNPWRTDRTPGAGPAAAVASGLVPIAIDDDRDEHDRGCVAGFGGLGSVGAAAACCGLIGLRPGLGGIPSRSGGAEPFGAARHGIVATNAADAALGFAVLAGRDPVPLPIPDRVRVAVALRGPTPLPAPDPDARESVLRTARLLAAHGHDAVLAAPAYPTRFALADLAAWAAPGARWPARLLPGDGPAHLADWRDRCLAWFARGYDALLLPALAGPAPRAGRHRRRPAVREGSLAAPWSRAELPVLCLPSGVRRDGLPGAVLLVGAPDAEPVLLALAAQLESAAPWRPHAPSWPRLTRRRADHVRHSAISRTASPPSAL